MLCGTNATLVKSRSSKGAWRRCSGWMVTVMRERLSQKMSISLVNGHSPAHDDIHARYHCVPPRHPSYACHVITCPPRHPRHAPAHARQFTTWPPGHPPHTRHFIHRTPGHPPHARHGGVGLDWRRKLHARALQLLCDVCLPLYPTFQQGLTLVHLSAQRKHFVWDRGCMQVLFRGCLVSARGYLGLSRV